MHSAARIVRVVSNGCALLAAALLSIAVLVICYMIVRRASGYSSFWEIEASIYLTVAATFLASPYTLRTGGHVSVDVIPDMFPPRARRALMTVLKFVGLLVCLYLTFEGVRLTHEAWASNERSISMWRPPRWPMYVMMPVGMGLTALQYLVDIFTPAADSAQTSADPERA